MESTWGAIKDPGLRRDLVSAGVPIERVAALMVYPAIHAAWADGQVKTLERIALIFAGGRAELERADIELVLHWTQEQPKNPEVLLDLTWRLYECLPALQQRYAPDLAFGAARTVARCSGGLLRLFRIGEEEQQALAEITQYAEGAGLETARRTDLSWSLPLERALPGLTLVEPEEVAAAEGSPLSGTVLAALQAVQQAPHMREVSAAHNFSPQERRRFLRGVYREREKDLLPPVRDGFSSLNDAERELIGAPSALTEIEPWQACRLALLLVCRTARAPDETFDLDGLLTAQAEGDEEYLERFLARDVEASIRNDRVMTPALLRQLVDGDTLEFVCRHYVRAVCGVYRALRRTSASLRDTFLIPLFGVHDARVRQGHAWCLFVDGARGVACALDPTAADGWWDAGRAESFLNPLLPARGYANLSALLVRFLLASKSPGLDAACELVGALEPEARARIAARLLIQWPLSHFLEDEEFQLLSAKATAIGAPEAFLERARELRDVDLETFSTKEAPGAAVAWAASSSALASWSPARPRASRGRAIL